MDERIKKYCHDILVAIESIDSYLEGRRIFQEYIENKMLRRAVEREMEIIGEAVSKINQIDPNLEISAKKQIVGMRNRVIHGYDKVDDEIVWGAVIKHLPALKTEINGFLGLFWLE